MPSGALVSSSTRRTPERSRFMKPTASTPSPQESQPACSSPSPPCAPRPASHGPETKPRSAPSDASAWRRRSITSSWIKAREATAPAPAPAQEGGGIMTSPPPRRTVQPPCEESPASPPARSAVGGRAEAKPAAAGLGALGAFRETKPVPAPAKQPTRLSRYSRRQLTPRTRAAAHRPQKASRRSPKTRPPHPVERSHRPAVLDSVIEHVAQEKPATGRRPRRFRRLHQPRAEAQKALQLASFGRRPSS